MSKINKPEEAVSFRRSLFILYVQLIHDDLIPLLRYMFFCNFEMKNRSVNKSPAFWKMQLRTLSLNLSAQ